jgi:hypothetical protein
MEIIEEIKQICIETDNEWFLTHDFTRISLYDLILKKEYYETDFDYRKCVCHKGIHCNYCNIEMEREKYADENEIQRTSCYDFNNEVFLKSIWIIPEKINNKIPGFILIKCHEQSSKFEDFTHELVFACVRREFRNKGVLKQMVKSIPENANIWLEANSNQIKNIEVIWEKCGFTFHKNIIYNSLLGQSKHVIYKR